MEEKGAFKIIESKAVVQHFAAIMRRAVQLGIADSVRASALIINEALRDHPRNFGEPKYHLNQARLEVRSGAEDPLAIQFAVHDDLPLVFVRNIFLLGQGEIDDE